MIHRRVVCAPIVAIGTLLLASNPIARPSVAEIASNAGPFTSSAAGEWTAPRTADGQPDLQGYWTNQSFTPLERPSELAGKEWFTKEEAEAYLKKRVDQFRGQARTDIHYDDAIWQAENYESEPNLQTSLIRDPRDGKIPPLTPEAEKRARARAEASRALGPGAGVETRTLSDRCISWGNVGPPMIPPSYNANFQILQTRDAVLIHHEMIHDVRIIPLDGRPHLPATIRRLAGDSRGRWEGDTLVVDTTNFTDRTNFRGAPRQTRRDIFATETLHVVERFTRVAVDRIRYEFSVRDPQVWTGPWSGEMPLRKFDGPLYEYACHEGNYGLTNILRGELVSESSSLPGGTR
jgi:hypothetical protein